MRLISSIRKLGYRQKIILYNLGIAQDNLKLLEENSCHLEIRNFNFSNFPPSMTQLKSYRWKSIVIAQVLRDYGSLWYLDSSVIFEKSNVSHVYDLVNCYGKVRKRYKVYKYFPTNPGELKKEKAKMYDAGFVFAVNTRQTMMNIVKWYFLCALEEDCMAPKSAVLGCQFVDDDRFRTYAGCHRYDQSIINLVLANQFWYDRRYYVSQIVDFFHIDRAGTSGNFQDHMKCI
ncbi:hypothetical protein B9Z55_003551 [Caenorhabditis nigoni]|uniref:Nucleotide-diphospho-sugar transferase domain-containing protein n=1 Tax=Caenorhabditis nigoni TaxID=1611254 RepID=A0A2G5VQV6_9PELO|nr:hypothetical protein B9Z55_003551 [Caenorhabditis nigoni]